MPEPHHISPILQDLAEMTGHRTHSRLEESVIGTLLRLPQVHSVGMVDLLQDNGADSLFYKYRQVGGSELSAFIAPPMQRLEDKQPLQDVAHLRQAISAGRSYCLMRWRDASGQFGHGIWLIVWRQQKAIQCIELRQYESFNAQRIELICAVFQVYQNYQNLLDYSERDALTGLLNRKTFDDLRFQLRDGAAAHNAAGSMGNRCQCDDRQCKHAHSDKPLAQWLAMIDIDSFKQINDQFGHLYGDEVLILVSNILRKNFRHTDRLFRYGGEEFIVLLKEAELCGVKAILEQLRQSVAAFSFPQVGKVTVSIGFARADGVVLANLLEQADRALYFVKKNGKNQVAYYEDLLASGKVHLPVQNSEVDLF